jgi:uncharacterized iron-regulated membrane protein
MKNTTSRIAAHTRWYRKWHRSISIVAVAFLTIIAITGLLLTWKKNSNGYLLANTMRGNSTNAAEWISFDSLQKVGIATLAKELPEEDATIDRIDVRPDKGIAKIRFKNHYTALQIDLATGKLLCIEKRRADFIEQIHDGTILDTLTGSNYLKLIYGSFAGFALLFLSMSGFYLWINPKRIRKLKIKERV